MGLRSSGLSVYKSIRVPRGRGRSNWAPPTGANRSSALIWCMAKRREPVDDLLDALVWMRRKAKSHAPVDDLIDALMKMRRQARKKLAKRTVGKRARSKSKKTKQAPRKSAHK